MRKVHAPLNRVSAAQGKQREEDGFSRGFCLGAGAFARGVPRAVPGFADPLPLAARQAAVFFGLDAAGISHHLFRLVARPPQCA